MQRHTAIGTLVLVLSLGASGARAEAGTGSDWDDSHMQSNFARQQGPAPPRPAVQGTDRYHTATDDPTATPPTSVAETTLRISPHEWTPGGPTSASGRSTPPWVSKNSVSSNPRPTASGGVRTGSSSRANSAGTQRSRR